MKTFEHEPVEGLPEKLPEGEHVLWRGRPSLDYLARHAFRVRLCAAYFGFFVVLRGVIAYGEGASVSEAILSAAIVAPIGLAGLGILVLMAWAHARTTIYTLTNKRVVLRYGVAIPMMVNLPFKAVISAEFKKRANGEGEIPIKLGGGIGPGYAHLWPHVRPWRFSRPEPMLRGVADAEEVAKVFAEALIAFREGAPLGPRRASFTSSTQSTRTPARPAATGIPATAE